MKSTPRCSRMAPRPMFSAGLTYSAEAEREDSTRQAAQQAQQARQVYACPAYSSRGFPLAPGQQGALVARETDTQVFTNGATFNDPRWPDVLRQGRTKDITRQARQVYACPAYVPCGFSFGSRSTRSPRQINVYIVFTGPTAFTSVCSTEW